MLMKQKRRDNENLSTIGWVMMKTVQQLTTKVTQAVCPAEKMKVSQYRIQHDLSKETLPSTRKEGRKVGSHYLHEAFCAG